MLSGGGYPQGSVPVPPAPSGVSAGALRQADRGNGIDNWFLERLFGRR
jgi:hypothetical protein